MDQDIISDVVVETLVSNLETHTDPSSAGTMNVKMEGIESASDQALNAIQKVVSVPPIVSCIVANPLNKASGDYSSSGGQQSQMQQSGNDQSQDVKQYCCLLDAGKRCHRVAGNASFSRKINKMAAQKGLKLNTDINCKHIYICDYHKNLIQRGRPAKVVRKQQPVSDDENTSDSFPRRSSDSDPSVAKQCVEAAVKTMSLNVLKRYKQIYKVSGKGTNKMHLQELVLSHFDNIPIVESEVILNFFRILRTNSNKLDKELPAFPSTPSPTSPPPSTTSKTTSNSKHGNGSSGHILHLNNNSISTGTGQELNQD